MSFVYTRTIRFQDTDAAGVVYFTNVLAICHEAYEASLAATGIVLHAFFRSSAIAVPIVEARVDLLQPMVCGDRYTITLSPNLLSPQTFEIFYQVSGPGGAERLAGKGYTKHVCIDPARRTRQDLPPVMTAWLHRWSDATS